MRSKTGMCRFTVIIGVAKIRACVTTINSCASLYLALNCRKLKSVSFYHNIDIDISAVLSTQIL